MRLSHSRLQTFIKCPYQFALKYLDKLETIPTDDPQSPLILGHALHTGIEKTVEDAIEEYYNSYPVISDLHVNEALKLEYWIPKVKELLPKDGIHELEIKDKDFIGYIDYLAPLELPFEHEYEMYDLYDFKYSNNVQNYMNSEQLHLYKYYFEKLNPTKKIRNMYFIFIPKCQIKIKYKNKTNPRDETLYEFRKRIESELDKKEIQVVKIDYDEKYIKQFKENSDELENHLFTDDFPKNPTRLCDWCEYQKLCEKGEDYMILPSKERRKIEKVEKKVIWIYGQPFSGKTYLSDKFPDPLMLNTDGNIKFVTAPFIPIKDIVTVEGRITKRQLAWDVFKETIDELEKKQNDFKTIVVDLVEDTYEYCRLYMYDKLGISHESDDSFRAWDKVRTEFLSTIRRLMNLDYENIVLISHEDMTKDITKKSGDKITSIKPNINEKCANKLAGMVDIVLRAVAEDDVYTLSFKKSEVVFGGGRLDNIKVKEIPNDYDALMKVYAEANGGAKPLEVPETPKQEMETPEKPKRARKPKEIVEEAKEQKAPEEEPKPVEETPARRRRKKREE